MAAELKPYRAYKDSGVEWLGAVPAHWEVRHLGRFGRLFRGGGGTKEDERESGVPCVRYGDLYTQHQFFITATRACVTPELANTVYTPIRYRDVLFAGSGETIDEIGKSAVNLIPGPACCGGDVIILRPSIDADARFLGYAMDCAATARQKACIGRGFTVVHIYSSDLKYVTVAMPSLPEQAAIVRFLNHADRRIRRCIRTQQKLIALLEEQKQAILHEAATGRIDVRTGRPYPAYRDSGVEWLGAVPAHWDVMRVKQVSRVLRGAFTHRPRNDPSLYDGPYPFIQTGEVAGADKRISSYRQTLNDRGLAVSRMFPAGTLVMAIAANIGDVAVLDFEACFPDSVVGFVPGERVERDFLYYVFRAMRPELLREAPVNTQGNLNVDRVGSRRIPIPPHDEQGSVVRKIETNTVRLNAAIRRLECGVDLLRIFRTRLVADVVTGKLDVREAAAGLPDLDLLATDEDPDDDFNRYARSEASGDAEEGGPGPDGVDAERAEAAAGELMVEGG